MVSPVRRLKRRIWLGRHRCHPGRPGRKRLQSAGNRSRPENLQHAITGYFLATFGVPFEQGENDVLLARTGHILDASLFGHFEQFGNRLLLEFSQVHMGNDVIMYGGEIKLLA